uniref:Reverse transcriptase Ty1/copia-type domain-containing protein n=1 Tax=Peronospora matthiolae TaxID=2874970 RepID=A0AAV1UHM8_9STRA
MKTTAKGTTVVGVSVDDLLVIVTSDELLDAIGAAMQILELKCLRSVKNSLGMRIGYGDLHGYTVDREKMITKLLHKNRLEKANAVRSPVSDEASIDSESTDAQPRPALRDGTAE